MSDTVNPKENIQQSSIENPVSGNETKKASSLKKALKILLWTVAGIIAAVILAAVAATLYLTPSRVASIVSKEASKQMKADLRIADVNWTLWSSFPLLKVEIDSISIRSRALDSIPSSQKQLLPHDADRLASTGRLKGAINILKAIKGDITLSGIEIDNPSVNLVALNDSVANFLIIPSSGKKIEIPHITIDTINIGRPILISFTDLSRQLKVGADISRLNLKGEIGSDEFLSASLKSDISVESPYFTSPRPIPVSLDGDVNLSKDAAKINLKDLKLKVYHLSTTISTIVNIEDITSIFPFSLSLDSPDIMELLPLVPEEYLPKMIDKVNGMIPLRLKADLLSPMVVGKSTGLPAFAASISSDNGKLSFPLSASQNMVLEGLGLDADINVDPARPADSRLRLSDLRMLTDGTTLHISGLASEILSGNPDISLDLQCAADLQKASSRLLPNSSFKVKGDLTGNTSLSCKLADLSKKQLKNLKLDGDFQVAALSLNDAASRFSAALADFSLKIGVNIPQIAPSSLSDGKLLLSTYFRKGEFSAPSQGVKALLENTSLNGDFSAKGSMSAPLAGGVINLDAGKIGASQGANKFSSNNLDVNLKASMRQIPFSPSNFFPTNPTSAADSTVAADFKHTPLYLTASLPPMMQSVLSLLNLKAHVTADNGSFYTPAYPAVNRFSDLRLNTNLDTLTISSLRFSTRGASGFLKGKVYGLRSFIFSTSPVPLIADIVADLREVNVNKLAGNYFRGQQALTGKSPVFMPAPLGKYTATDSLCVAIPRNITLNADLSAGSAQFMQYSFSPLSANIRMKGGDAELKGLSIGTPFCTNSIDWTFSTSNLDSVSMALKADVDDFDFTKFQESFPEVAQAAPQLKNLSADISLHADGNFIMNPDMFVEAPSIEGDVSLNVRDLSFKRDKEALKYTHMMLIRGDKPITIDSLDIHAAFHDNLLQLDPFTIDGGGYKLLIGGVNNLRGQMYYHIGLLHNPLHLPFGVNLVGYYRHPEFRFGGRWIKDGRERKIAAELGSDVKVNIMRNLRYGWLEFIGMAGKYDFKNN